MVQFLIAAARKLGSWMIILMITIALLELVLRMFDEIPVHRNPLSGFHVADSTLGWIGRPDYRGRFRSQDFNVVIEHDAQGFRRSTFDTRKLAESSRRIALLGDSFTWGWGVENDELFANLLQDRLGSSALVKNYGVSAFGTAQELLLFDRYVQELDPDIVMVMFHTNDLDDNVDSNKGRRPWFELEGGQLVARNQPVSTPAVGLIKQLTQKSTAISTIKFTYHLIVDAFKSPAEGIYEYVEPVIPEDRWLLMAALVAELHRRCGLDVPECELRIVYIPTREEVSAYDADQVSVVPAGLKDICAKAGINFLDLRPVLYSAWQQAESPALDVTPVYFPHDGHLDTKGHQIVAEALADSLGVPKLVN